METAQGSTPYFSNKGRLLTPDSVPEWREVDILSLSISEAYQFRSPRHPGATSIWLRGVETGRIV